MELELTPNEVRVLGSLAEKELTTPDYYPLTLNSLTLACNQKSNRDPVTTLSENDVRCALGMLRGKNLIWEMAPSGSRVHKFEHNLRAKFGFTTPDISILCVLMLRGSLTIGEIRGCTGRMHPFKDTAEVEAVLQTLIEAENGPFVVKLPKQPGCKEHRFAHLMSGAADLPVASLALCDDNSIAPVLPSSLDRITELETTVAALYEELAALKLAFEDFKKSFE
jgi:uncharacterized protein